MRNLTFILLAFICYSCAQIRTPTGGEKDILGPQITVSYPQHLETNYNSKSIVLEFDELVTLNDPSNNIVITPPLKNKPEIYLKRGSELVISFNDTLQEATTYTINLGESISDYNEGNPLDSAILVFSTGDFIDSLSIEGQVKISETDIPCIDCKVMLYESYDDSVVFNEQPYYFAQTDEQGFYKFNYLKAGEYKTAAIKEDLNDFLFDPSLDMIGFSDSLIHLVPDTNVLFVPLTVFKQIPEKQSLLSFKMVSDQQLSLAFAMPVSDLKLMKDSIDFPPDNFITSYSSKKDSLDIWFKNVAEKNTEWKLSVIEQGEQLEYFSIFFNDEQNSFMLKSPRINGVSKYNSKDTLKLIFSAPVTSLNQDGITITKDSTLTSYTVLENDPFNFDLLFDKIPGVSYILRMDSASAVDIYGNVIDSMMHNMLVQEDEYFGQLTLKLRSETFSKVVILKNVKGVTVRSEKLNESGVVRFTDLEPGKYDLYILYDENENLIWDTGNYLKKIKPERVQKHGAPISVRSNWELEMDLSY